MSNGAVFNLISNTSIIDKLLFANDFLKERIKKIIIEKQTNNPNTQTDKMTLPEDGAYSNVFDAFLPSLNEIERTHNTYINSTYKPNVLLTSEYIKVANNSANFGSTVVFQFPQQGQFSSDSFLHIQLSGMSSNDYRDRLRYVAMLGHKLVKHVQFTVSNGGILDEYTTDDYNAYFQFEIPSGNRDGYLNNIGQEIPTVGYITPDPTTDMFREYKLIGNGNQTLKHSHGVIDLYIPLLLWFKDQRNALPMLPWGQLQVKVVLANLTDIIGIYDGGGGGSYSPPTINKCDLYVNQLWTIPEIFELYARKFVFSIIRTHRSQKVNMDIKGNSTYEILLSNLKFPVETLWFGFRPVTNLSLSQYWFKYGNLVENSYKTPVAARNANDVLVLNTQSSTVSTVIPTIVIPGANGFYNNYNLNIISGKGYNPIDIELNSYIVVDYDSTTYTLTIDGEWRGFLPDTTTVFELFIPKLAFNSVVYYNEAPVVKSISLISHGIDIYKHHNPKFYTSYLPLKYSEVNTPLDAGMHMMSFCSHPLKHNPSGSLDLSICRETYLTFTTPDILVPYNIDVIVLARTINFIIVDPVAGGINLRYIT